MTHTIESLKDKTPEELNVICAELCGWRLEWKGEFAKHDRNRELIHMLRPDGEIEIAGFFERSEYGQLHRGMSSYVPPYATSYNTIMREIDKLTDGQLRQFDTHVCGILAAQNDWDLWKASPADLTRALILTKQTNEETK